MDIDIDMLQDFLDDDLPITEIANIFHVSTKTIYRNIERHKLIRHKYADISDDDLVDIIIEIKQNHPNDGEVLMDGHLKARTSPIKIQRWKLRAAIHHVDSEGVNARRSVTIKRRQYSVPCPHYMWHIDGNHKLIKWKMVIHGGVDGFTRLVTFMNISNNNKAATVHRAFLGATEQFQWPIRVRTDFGGENELVWQEMLGKRGERSALVGSSVHNQPIEQLWGLINDRATLPFKVLFQTLEREGKLNTDNKTDMMCLHWVFLPLIQRNLTRLCLALNKRKISTEHQRTPCQLETQFLPLTAPFEGIPIEQHDGVDTAYEDPATLERPLQHVQCFGFDGFPRDLRHELHTLGIAHEIDQGRTLYQQVMSMIVFEYMEQHSEAISAMTNLTDYPRNSGMDCPGKWGTEVEVFAFASLLGITIFIYGPCGNICPKKCFKWMAYKPLTGTQSIVKGSQVKDIYINNTGCHFEPVLRV